MKKQTEYIFSDTLRPKTLVQKILAKIGLWKQKELLDHQVIINRPTAMELGIPSEKKLQQIKAMLSTDEYFYKILVSIDFGYLSYSDLVVSVSSLIKDFDLNKLNQSIVILKDAQFIFFDDIHYSLSPIAELIIKDVRLVDKDGKQLLKRRINNDK